MSGPADTIPRDYNFAADILKRNLDAGRGEKVAYIDHRGSYSYAALAARVERFGHVLRALDVRREERVLMCLTDTIDWPTAFLGAIKTGVVAVPVNTLLTEDDYRFMLEDSRARLLVVSEELLPKFAKAIETSKHIELVIVSGEAPSLPSPASGGGKGGGARGDGGGAHPISLPRLRTPRRMKIAATARIGNMNSEVAAPSGRSPERMPSMKA